MKILYIVTIIPAAAAAAGAERHVLQLYSSIPAPRAGTKQKPTFVVAPVGPGTSYGNSLSNRAPDR